jgi:hypothetical protein
MLDDNLADAFKNVGHLGDPSGLSQVFASATGTVKSTAAM